MAPRQRPGGKGPARASRSGADYAYALQLQVGAKIADSARRGSPGAQ